MTLDEAYEKILNGKSREEWINDNIEIAMKHDPNLWKSVASFRAECDLETLARCMIMANSEHVNDNSHDEIVNAICKISNIVSSGTQEP